MTDAGTGFTPAMPQAEREAIRDRWQAAIRQTLTES